MKIQVLTVDKKYNLYELVTDKVRYMVCCELPDDNKARTEKIKELFNTQAKFTYNLQLEQQQKALFEMQKHQEAMYKERLEVIL